LGERGERGERGGGTKLTFGMIEECESHCPNDDPPVYKEGLPNLDYQIHRQYRGI